MNRSSDRAIPRVAFLAGKGGGDFIALSSARKRCLVDFLPVAVICTSKRSRVLEICAQNIEFPSPVLIGNIKNEREAAFVRIAECLAASRPDWVILCGFTFLIPAWLVRQYSGRIINTHHAALPEHPGLFKKEELVSLGEPYLAATVHKVDEGIDTGRILARGSFPNFGMAEFEKILNYYRFLQDLLVIQVFRDLTGFSSGDRVEKFMDIHFEPALECCIINETKEDYGF